MSRTTKLIMITLVVIIALLIVFWSGRRGKDTEKVSVEKVSRRTIVETVSTTGKIFPETEIRVSPDYSGQVTELRVAEGDTVKKGQVLARINNRSSIEASIDGVVLSLKVKEGESVTGNSFSVGTEIMTVADMSLLEVRAEVGESDILKISVGDSADITVDAHNNKKFRGVVTRIANSTRSTGTSLQASGDITNYEVKVRLDTNSYKEFEGRSFPFRPGMNASVEIRTKKTENVIAVPIAAVTSRVKDSDQSIEQKREADQKNKDDVSQVNETREELEEVVFVLHKDGTVKKTVVQTGIQDITYIEVKTGLNEGTEVVTGPYSALSKNLRTGMKVKVVPKNKLFE